MKDKRTIRPPGSENKRPKARRGALQVHESLREDILWLRTEPGSALDELALAERFKVSRMPIREALLLSSEGFVKFLPNRTTIVSPLSLDNAGGCSDTFLILSRAVARAAAASGRARPDELRSMINRFSRAAANGDHERAVRAGQAFLRHLASLAGNTFLERYFDQILDAGVRMCVLHYFSNAAPAELREAADRMTELSEAIAAGDPDRSDACISRMIRADNAIIMRSIQPQYGYDMEIGEIGSGHD